jgi:anti-sigma B factor antagonist
MTSTGPTDGPAEATLDLEVDDCADTYVLRCRGEIDMSTCERFDAALACVGSNGHSRVVVDLSGVHFMDSTGLNCLVRARNRLSDTGHQLSVRGASPATRKLFAITCVDGLLDCE